jgi:hypothetical protein
MKRLFFAATLLVTAVAAFAWAAGAGSPPGPAQDRVYGGGRYAGGGSCSDGAVPLCPPNSREISISANASPNGDGVYGTLRYGVPETGASLALSVTCMAVSGHDAVGGGTTADGTPFRFFLRDRGPAGSTTHDQVGPLVLIGPGEAPIDCNGPVADPGGAGYFNLAYGDVVVEDR